MLLDLCVLARRFEYVLEIKSGSRSQFISHHPDSRLKDTFQEEPQRGLLCVEDICEILVVEAIERRCFKTRKRSSCPASSRSISGPNITVPIIAHALLMDKDLPRSFRCLEGLRYLVEYLAFTPFFLMECRPLFVSLSPFLFVRDSGRVLAPSDSSSESSPTTESSTAVQERLCSSYFSCSCCRTELQYLLNVHIYGTYVLYTTLVHKCTLCTSTHYVQNIQNLDNMKDMLSHSLYIYIMQDKDNMHTYTYICNVCNMVVYTCIWQISIFYSCRTAGQG